MVAKPMRSTRSGCNSVLARRTGCDLCWHLSPTCNNCVYYSTRCYRLTCLTLRPDLVHQSSVNVTVKPTGVFYGPRMRRAPRRVAGRATAGPGGGPLQRPAPGGPAGTPPTPPAAVALWRSCCSSAVRRGQVRPPDGDGSAEIAAFFMVQPGRTR